MRKVLEEKLFKASRYESVTGNGAPNLVIDGQLKKAVDEALRRSDKDLLRTLFDRVAEQCRNKTNNPAELVPPPYGFWDLVHSIARVAENKEIMEFAAVQALNSTILVDGIELTQAIQSGRLPRKGSSARKR